MGGNVGIDLVLRANRQEYFNTRIHFELSKAKNNYSIDSIILLAEDLIKSDPKFLDIGAIKGDFMAIGYSKCAEMVFGQKSKENPELIDKFSGHLSLWRVGDPFVPPMYVKGASALTLKDERG